MQSFKKNSLTIFFLLLLNFAVAQKFPSKNYSTLDGLSSNSIYTIFKDSRGILWVGTNNGLVKIIGNDFQSFYEKDGLAFNNCWDIKEDKNKNLWFASYGGGLTFYDGKKFKIINQESGLVHNNIRKLYLSGNNIFIGTHDGVSIIDINSFKITNLKISNPKFGNFQVMDFFTFNDEVYFVTYRDGNWKINLKNNKLEFVSFFHDCLISAHQKNNYLHVGIDGFGFPNKGINLFKTEDFINGKQPQKSFGKNVYWQFSETQNKCLVTANGVNFVTGGIFEIKNNNVVDVSTEYGIDSKQCWSLHFDAKTEKLFTGTIDKGFFETDLKHKIKFYDLAVNNENAIKDIENLNNYYYFLTDDNFEIRRNNQIVKKYNLPDFYKFANLEITKNKKLFTQLTKEFLFNTKDTSHKLLKFKVIDNKLWIISTIGLFTIDSNNDFQKYYYYFATNIEKDFDNEILFHQPHISTFKTKNYTKNQGLTEFSINEKNNPRDVSEIIKMKNKIFYFSTSKGLFEYQNGLFKSLLNQSVWKEKNLTFAKKLNENQIAVSNAQGDIFVIDVKNKFQLIKKIDREMLFGKTISFIESYKNNLLIATEKGINIYNGKTIRLIDKEIGFENNIFSSGLVVGDSLTVGSKNGFYKFDLKKYLSSKAPSLQLSISKLEINYQPLSKDNFKWFQLVKNEIELTYDKNTVSLIFNPRNHPYPNKLLYRYKVLGLSNANWSNFSSNKTIMLPYLPNGNFEIVVDVKDLYAGTTSSHKILKININPPFWKTWWFITGTIGFLILIGFIIHKKRIDYIQNQERTKAEVQKRLAETKMEALQSQMNPHFIFNAMNSIQNYIIDNNTDDALMYMGEFSKLIRQTLNNSSKTKINLLEELQYLQSYVILENMRFKNIIDFDLKVSDEVDIFETEIPPMLIQPFLENAFIHAFDSSSINPKLNLSFEIKNNNLFIEINDNGKGLDVKNLNQLTESKGIKLAQERITLFQPNEKDSITITSKINEGTSIVLRISNQNLNDNS